METFSLLKYWRGGVAANLRLTNPAAANVPAAAAAATTSSTTTIATSVLRPSTESEDGNANDNDDEGSFFDLEFAVNESIAEIEDSTSESGDDETEALSDHQSVSLSPPDDLFFKGQLLPLDPSSILITTATSSDSDPKSSQFPVSLLKSATRFRVFMLGLKKPKSDPNAAVAAAAAPKQNQANKFFIKFKVEEVPIVSLFTREGSGGPKNSQKILQRSDEEPSIEEKKFSKETVQKYINKIKPLYVRVSKRYGEKLRFSGQLTANGEVTATDEAGGPEPAASPAPAPAPAPAAAAAAATAKVKLPAGLRVVRKKLGKSKSSSAVVAAIASPPATAPQRSDDSLLEQQDGIQSAIAHCKRSLNEAAAAKGSQSPLFRSKSDPTSEKGNGDRSG